jgi:hypothetical protein
MNNIEKYNNVFLKEFSLNTKELFGLKYQGISSWDSVGHMNLVASIEEEFDIMLDTDDIVEFSSYEKGIEILAKYEIKL